MYRQAKAWDQLPLSGGLLDQPAVLMDLLDAVEIEVEKWRQKRSEEREGEAMKQQMARALGKQ